MSIAAPEAPDPLEEAPAAERVNYATGVMLDAADFRDEQTYHRGRLATALRHLFGFGTLAGLLVRPPEEDAEAFELRVEPGVAIDRHGRLIEVREPWCLRLDRWFEGQETALLRALVRRAPRVEVVADVFLSVRSCGRAKTPAFATGPFDALDAVVPARLAELPALELVPRAEAGDGGPPAPQNHWPGAGANAATRLRAVLGSWEGGTADRSDRGLDPLAEHVEGQDASAVLLARIGIPVELAADAPSGTRPQLRMTERVSADNSIRPFIFLPGKWLGRAAESVPLVIS